MSSKEYENLENVDQTIAYPNNVNLNYPNSNVKYELDSENGKVVTLEKKYNTEDKRSNKIYNNKNTFWRHAGGAVWLETPAPTKKDSVKVTGVCNEEKGFYPKGVYFIDKFGEQYIDIFNKLGNDATTADIKKYDLRNTNSILGETRPTRTCNKWGIWSEISDRCVATCEMLDPFRTVFNDNNGNGLLENVEITALYKNPETNP